MSAETFQLVVAAAVVLACMAFLVQAGVVIALYVLVRRTQQRVLPLIERAEPVVEKAGPLADNVRVLLEKAAPVIEKAGPAVEQVRPLLEKAGAVVATVPPLVDKASALLDTAQEIVTENRPKIGEITEEAVATAKAGARARGADRRADAGCRRARQDPDRADRSIRGEHGTPGGRSGGQREASRDAACPGSERTCRGRLGRGLDVGARAEVVGESGYPGRGDVYLGFRGGRGYGFTAETRRTRRKSLEDGFKGACGIGAPWGSCAEGAEFLWGLCGSAVWGGLLAGRLTAADTGYDQAESRHS